MFVFFNDTSTPEIYTLSLHDALPISPPPPEPTSVAVQPQAVGPFEPGQPFTARWQTTGPVSFHAVRLAYDGGAFRDLRSEEHTSELQSRQYLVCRLLLEKKKLIKIDT